MSRTLFARLGPALVLAVLPAGSAAQSADARPLRVDSVFAPWDRTTSPGCALGVLQDGRFLYRRGYGMADLEQGIPITPSTVFYTGSLSKQFTAMSVALLAQDGVIGLDDRARTWIPELPEVTAPITIRHLLHHQSGLREKWDLLAIQGRREADLVTQQDVLDLVRAQRALNFRPGDEYLYNNTAYDLLAVVVERAAGKSLPRLARERIFGPLGMESSDFVDDRTRLIPRRAKGHSVQHGAVTLNLPNVETVGSGSVYSSVEDLARWDEAFYGGGPFGAEVLRLVQQPGRLNDGRVLPYAFGLEVDRWRGLQRVAHTGSLAGFRTAIVRFPERHFSVIVLCNVAQATPESYALRVAAVYLADVLHEPPPRPPPATVPLDPAVLTRYEGVYLQDRTNAWARVERADNGLTISGSLGRNHLFPLGDHRFRLGAAVEAPDVVFEDPGSASMSALRVHRETAPPTELRRVAPPAPMGRLGRELPGRYHSAELDVTWVVEAKEGRLVLRMARGREAILSPVFEDGFSTEDGWVVRVARAVGGRVSGLLVTTGRSRNVLWERQRDGRPGDRWTGGR